MYYTAVESFHTDAAIAVSGCLDLGCSSKGAIGSYPQSFVTAVQDEGTGRITSGTHAGMYLNWSYDVGYWLDSAARDSYGGALLPWVSAAADPGVLPRGTAFKVLNCGKGVDTSVCSLFKAANWKVVDEFTPGLGGAAHEDVHIGEEDQPDFTNTSAKYTTAVGATIEVLP